MVVVLQVLVVVAAELLVVAVTVSVVAALVVVAVVVVEVVLCLVWFVWTMFFVLRTCWATPNSQLAQSESSNQATWFQKGLIGLPEQTVPFPNYRRAASRASCIYILLIAGAPAH